MRALQDLDARFGRSRHVTFTDMFGGAVAVLDAGGARAIVALQGAQVLSYTPASGSEALWLSPTAQLGTGKAVRGGVPICWPWFGPHPQDASKPAHGFVRAAPWTVVGSAAASGRARLVLAYDATRVPPELWPHNARAEVEITLDESLSVSLTTSNVGTSAFDLTEALHTYIRVGDIAQVTVAGLTGSDFIDQLAANTPHVQAGSITFCAETDRIYQNTGHAIDVDDPALGRRVTIEKTGSRSTIVWNPWSEKAARLGDLGPDGYRHMVCIEAANAGHDKVTLAPGERHRIMSRLIVRERLS